MSFLSSSGSLEFLVEFTTLQNTFSNNLSDFEQPNSFYNYDLDGNAQEIGDGGNDMYDGGNNTFIRENSSRLTGPIAYNNTAENEGNRIVWGALGLTQPLAAFILVAEGSAVNHGFERTGNTGRDGDGTATDFTFYNGSQRNGIEMYGWSKSAFGDNDPSIAHFHCTYVTAGSNNFSGFQTRTFANDTDNDASVYEVSASSAITVTTLLSRNDNSEITASEHRNVANQINDLIANTL